MKRTTVMLPDDLAQLVDRERRRRDVSAATVIREAVAAYLTPAETRPLPFIGIGRSGGGEPTARNMEEWLARESRSDEAYNRMKYGYATADEPTYTAEGAEAEPPGILPEESPAQTANHGNTVVG